MKNAIRPRRALAATLILTALIIASPGARASAMTTDASYSFTPGKICAIQWRDGTLQVKRLIRCAARYYGVNPDTAVMIAHRESLFHPDAYNAWSCAKGIYQHLCRYWPGRAYLPGADDRFIRRDHPGGAAAQAALGRPPGTPRPQSPRVLPGP